MKKELDNKLCKDFPSLYQDRNASMKVTCMCWGFPGDGWFSLIYDLSQQIDNYLMSQPPDIKSGVRASQVKEKFGLLRYYLDFPPNTSSKVWGDIHSLVATAEERSGGICETCGDPGILRGGGWIKTLCDRHAEGRPKLTDE